MSSQDSMDAFMTWERWKRSNEIAQEQGVTDMVDDDLKNFYGPV